MYVHDFLSSLIPSYFHLWHLPVVFLAGLIGEGYGTIVGSGGVIIQFALASLGMPLSTVVATDIAGALGANAGIMSSSSRKIWGHKKLLLLLAIPLFLGGIAGTLFLIYVPVIILKYIIIVGLVLLLLHMFIRKKTLTRTLEDLHIGLRQYPPLFAVMSVLGIYGNASAVGVGTFQKIVLVSLLRLSVADSIIIGSIVDAPMTAFSFAATAIAGLIAWPYVLMLWLGTFIGSRYATKFARKIPDKYLRGLLIAVVSLYLVWLLFSL